MAKQTVESLVEGGKATAAPPLGPALGPLGVNIGQVISEINKKTGDFKGMQVPIKVTVDTGDKTFVVTIGTPPVSSLFKNEARIEKGSGTPNLDKVADLRIEQIIKVAKMKTDSLLGKDMIAKVKEVIGTCNSMGIMVEGKSAKDAIADINNGLYVDKIRAGRTELTAEELRQQEEEKKRLQAEYEAKKKEYQTIAAQVLEANKTATRGQLKTKLLEAKIPSAYVDEFLPAEEKKAEGGKPAAPPAKK